MDESLRTQLQARIVEIDTAMSEVILQGGYQAAYQALMGAVIGACQLRSTEFLPQIAVSIQAALDLHNESQVRR